MSLPSVPSERALDKLLNCLVDDKREQSSQLNAVKLANELFSKTGKKTITTIKRDIGRRVPPRVYAQIDQRFEALVSRKQLHRPLEALQFLTELVNTKNENDEQLRSFIEVSHTSDVTMSRVDNTAFMMSAMTPHGDSSTLSRVSNQESFLKTGPKYESTPRDVPKSTVIEASLVGAPGGAVISEAKLIQQVLFIIQDIPSNLIKWNDAENEFMVDKRYRVDPRHASFIESISVLGMYLREINRFIEDKNQNQSKESLIYMRYDFAQLCVGSHHRSYGMIGQALIISVTKVIDEYLAFVGQTSEITQGMTLCMLKSMICDVWSSKLEYLALILYNIDQKRGGEILRINVLYYFIQHGNPMLKMMFQNILDASARPFFIQLDLWMYEGVLHDPFNEFLVAVDLQIPVEHFWTSRYRLNREFIPSFVSQNQAEKILLIGKSINFLREVCNQPDCEIKAPPHLEEQMGNDLKGDVEERLKLTYEPTSKRLLKVMNEKYNLPSHFKAMRSYMLLGQGDFVRHLLDTLQDELTKPASNLYRRNLAEQLETAIRSTNAQFDDPEVLKLLDVRLHEINPGDVGWDVFSLNYSVSGPLLTIFPTEVMRKYIRVFNFLLRAKRMEYNLNHLWGQMMSTSKRFKSALPEAYEVFYSSNLMSHEMGFFINQVQYYINFEILECSWAVLVEKLENASDLDELILAHLKFLDELADGCLLADNFWDNLKALRSIFDQIVRFESFQKKIFMQSEAEAEARQIYENRKKRGNFTNDDDAREDVRRFEFNESLQKNKYKIGSVRQTYQKMVRDFLAGLNASKDPNLRCLSWRLDFNAFYKDSEF